MSTEHSESTDIKCSSTAAPQEEQQTQELPNNENPPTSRQNPASHPSLPLQQDYCAEIVMNKALYDPPRWGWTALGGMADVLTPHEVSCFSFFQTLYHDVGFRSVVVSFKILINLLLHD